MMFHAFQNWEGFLRQLKRNCVSTIFFQALLGVASEVPWDRYIYRKVDMLDRFDMACNRSEIDAKLHRVVELFKVFSPFP